MNPDIESIALELAEAKANENAAKEARIELETTLMSLVSNTALEGSKTVSNDFISVTVTNKVTRACDFERLSELEKQLNDDHKLVSHRPTLNLKNYRDVYRFANEDFKSLIDEAITVKPAKSSVTVKFKEQ